MKWILVVVAWLAVTLGASATELTLGTPFADHMVLQCEKPIAVWGTANPDEAIVVRFAGQEKRTKAAADGSWMVKLDALAASAEARELLVTSATPDRTLRINDVLVGEVWLGSGQSNMAMTMNRARDFDQEKTSANLPLIRMFREESKAAKMPQTRGSGKWLVCAPDTIAQFSATLYCFGRELHRERKVPMGLINSSVGGTPIEAWTSADAQRGSAALRNFVAESDREAAAFDEARARADHEKALARWKEKASAAKAAGKPAPERPKDPIEQRNRSGGLGGLFNGKVAPLIPYTLRGIVWYQGEANTHPSKETLYRHQLPLLVQDWRTRWNDELPFAWVQLPNFSRPGEGWPLVREAMLQSLRLPKTGMAVTIDIGEPNNIHPANKQEVGRRLALWALGDVYGQKVASTCGPLPAGHTSKANELVVKFTHADGGLKSREGDLRGFQLAGADRVWKPAVARIENDTVVVSSAEVAAPVAVRYAWAPNPDVNLVNGAGLPASPFRTDDWPLSTEATEHSK